MGKRRADTGNLLSAPVPPNLDSGRDLLAAARPQLQTLTRSLAHLRHRLRLLDASGEPLLVLGDAFVADTMLSSVVELRGPGEALAGTLELWIEPGPAQPLVAALARQAACGIECAFQAEQALRLAAPTEPEDASLRLAAIIESSEDAIIGKTLDGVITNWNEGARRMYGYTAAEVIGRDIKLLSPPDRHAEIDDFMRRLRHGERITHCETVRVRKDGELMEVALSISPIRNAAGRIVGASTIARDITDFKRAERSLRMTEKLAATGRLAASIAHEINNPMASVTNLLYLLEHHQGIDETARAYVRLAEEELARVTHIVRQMLGFYRESEAPVALSIADVLDNIVLLYGTRLSNAKVRVHRRYDYEGHIRGFPGETRQVFSNLIINAVEAMSGGGTISLRVRRGRNWTQPEVTGVRVTVADTGPGIPRAALRRIFEPFFTTKGERGTGLGLWVSEGILRKHGGCIRLRSSTAPDHHGTCFSVFLPAEQPTPSERVA